MARLAAGVRKRADGSLEKRFTIDGKRYSVYGRTAREIAEREQEIRKAVQENAHATRVNITFNSYYAEWIERKAKTVKENTLYTYSTCFKAHILPTFGKKKLRNIGRYDIITFRDRKAQELSAGTCKYLISILRIMLEDAVNDDIITKNPASGIVPLKADREQATHTVHRALTVDEQRAFMYELRTDYYYTFCAMMISTGMRCGEVAALQWQDIDRDAGMIHVRRTVTRSASGKLVVGTSTKTNASTRDIPITENVAQILREQRKRADVLFMPSATVFISQYNTVVKDGSINRAIGVALRRLERRGTHIEPFTSHAFRDTFATRYIEGGGNMQTLKTLLGHTSLAMTADLYSHVLPDTKQAEMNSIHIAI